jgi:hypothetical protein
VAAEEGDTSKRRMSKRRTAVVADMSKHRTAAVAARQGIASYN